jgi:hypothetical protein
MLTIEKLIENASHDMFNPKHNFDIAKEYEAIGQTAAAMSFYLRSAEYGHETHPLLVYSSLIRISYCFAEQREREHTVETSLLQAIQHMPTRPEAYFVLSKNYERLQKWQQSYTFAELGLLHLSRIEPLPVDVGYYGSYCLEFQKAVAGWWLGRKNESKTIFEKLMQEDIPDFYKSSIQYNLEKL